jgi:outer membrane protein assembly factor BamB
LNCPKCNTPLPENNRFCYGCGNFLGVHPGYSLQGRFLVERFLGKGGFGQVYLGRDEQLMGKPVVIKELIATTAGSQALGLFNREADTLINLKHAAIPTCFAFFEELNHHYLILEYMRGPTMLEAIGKHGKFPEDVSRNIMLRLLDVLDYLHQQDPPLVHGDLSPENVILLPAGRIGLIDFGAIRVYEPELAAVVGPGVGKEIYAPPEQRRGEIHPASDLFALGVTALYMLTGRHPREIYNPYERLFSWPEDGLSPLVNTVVRRLVAADLKDRFETAGEAMDVLHAHAAVRGLGLTGLDSVSSYSDFEALPELPPFSQVRAPYHLGGGPPPNGRLAWRYKVGPILSSPALRNGTLYVGSLDHTLTAIDCYAGRFMWKFATKGSIACSPAIEGDVVFVGDEAGGLYALDAWNGTRKWTFRTGSPLGSSPVVADGIVYFGANDGYLFAVSPNGTERWRCISNLNDRIRSSPAISGPLVFVGTHGGSLFAFDLHSGIPQWEFVARGAITVSPVVDAGRVFVGCRAGWFYGVDAYSGRLVWEFQAPEAIDGTPAISGGMVYFGCRDGNLYCLDANDGRLRWTFAVESSGAPAPLSAIALVDNIVYFGSWRGRFFALDAEDGAQRWWFQTSAPVRSSAIVANGMVYVTCEDGYVYALE